MSVSPWPVCVFPTCAKLGVPADTPADRLCADCGRPLSGPGFGPETGYRIGVFLGSGYFADVFLALELESGIACAAKIYGDGPSKREAWARETAALRRLAHPRLPKLMDSFDEDGRLFVVMELIEGASLRQEVTRHGPLNVARAVKMCIDACEVLEYVSSQGWTYRDLHPSNIHLNTPKGTMLIDFDGARPPGWPAQPAGRVGYRAPELEAERPVSSACDVFSLVGCLYFALTGNDPPSELGPLPELRGLLARFPLLADLVGDGRLADPARRPTAGALRAALALLVSPND